MKTRRYSGCSRIMAGDRQAEAELIDSYSRGVSIIIRQAGCDAAVVDDLFQETFRIVLEKTRRGDIREPLKLPGFIRSVAKEVAPGRSVEEPSELLAGPSGKAFAVTEPAAEVKGAAVFYGRPWRDLPGRVAGVSQQADQNSQLE